jgi:predicted aspartyl protease
MPLPAKYTLGVSVIAAFSLLTLLESLIDNREGRLTFDHTPYIPLAIAGSLGEFIVDTGFGGAIYLSEDRIASLNLPFLTSAPIILANQSVVISDVFEATVVWFAVARRVAVIAGPLGCDALVGMELLKGCRIELDDVAGEVRIALL